MGAVPKVEHPPKGLREPWLAVWRGSLKEMKAVELWKPVHRPMLDEYVYALKAADEARNGFRWLDALEAYAEENAAEMELPDWRALAEISGRLPAMWDKHSKRAMELAGLLGLTPKAQKALVVKAKKEEDVKPEQGFDALDPPDDLKPLREKRAKAG